MESDPRPGLDESIELLLRGGPESVELLRGGPESVARWNAIFGGWTTYPSLEGADLRGCQLRGVNLLGARLNGALLTGADLSEANLDGADLSGADLSIAKLTRAISRQEQFGFNIERPLFVGANLSGATLSGATFYYADFTGADLRRVDAGGASLIGAEFKFAKLVGANLCGAILNHARLENAVVDRVMLGETHLVDINLECFCNAEELLTPAPSTVDYRSILRSVHLPRLRDFLRAVGMPEFFIEYNIECARSLSPAQRSSLLHTTFISYGGPDEKFAHRLNNALLDQGVTTFLFKKDAVPGERLDKMMRQGVNDHDRVILICSEASLERPGVLNELTEILAREARDGGAEYLIPIRLDDYVFTKWSPKRADLKQAVCDRVVADFSDPAEFKSGVGALIRALSLAKK